MLCIQQPEKIRKIGNLCPDRATTDNLWKRNASGEHADGEEPARGWPSFNDPAASDEAWLVAGPPCGPSKTRAASVEAVRAWLSYPKVSFEIKPLATLKTFSSRNALPDRAAIDTGGSRSVCKTRASWAIRLARCAPSAFADLAAHAGLSGPPDMIGAPKRVCRIGLSRPQALRGAEKKSRSSPERNPPSLSRQPAQELPSGTAVRLAAILFSRPRRWDMRHSISAGPTAGHARGSVP